MASKLSRVSLPKLSASQPTIRALSQSTPKSKSHESDTEAIQLQRIQEHLVKFQTHKPKKPRTFRKLPGLGLDLSKLTPAHTGPTPDHSAFNKVKETAALANSRRYQMEEENDLRKRLGRIWQQGDIYAPRDLGPAEQQKWMDRRDVRRKGDVFELIGKNPLLFYRNFTVLEEFRSPTGRIQHHKVTGLKLKNQRRIAKAIRRAVGLGLLPSVHAHPMVLGLADGVPRSF